MHSVIRWYCLSSLALLALLTAPSALAAKCSYATNTKDKFTKETTVQTDWNSLHGLFDFSSDSDFTMSISAYAPNDEQYLIVKISAMKFSDTEPRAYELEDLIVVSEGASLMVMMKDESVVELFSSQRRSARTHVLKPNAGSNITDNYVIDYDIDARYVLDAESAEALSAQDATHIRVVSDNKNYDIEIHKRSVGDIRNAVGCIQQAE